MPNITQPQPAETPLIISQISDYQGYEKSFVTTLQSTGNHQYSVYFVQNDNAYFATKESLFFYNDDPNYYWAMTGTFLIELDAGTDTNGAIYHAKSGNTIQ